MYLFYPNIIAFLIVSTMLLKQLVETQTMIPRLGSQRWFPASLENFVSSHWSMLTEMSCSIQLVRDNILLSIQEVL